MLNCTIHTKKLDLLLVQNTPRHKKCIYCKVHNLMQTSDCLTAHSAWLQKKSKSKLAWHCSEQKRDPYESTEKKMPFLYFGPKMSKVFDILAIKFIFLTKCWWFLSALIFFLDFKIFEGFKNYILNIILLIFLFKSKVYFFVLVSFIYQKGHQGFFIVHSKVGLLMFRNGLIKIYFFKLLSFWCWLPKLLLDLRISKICIYTKKEDDLSSNSYLLRLYRNQHF